MAYFGDSFTFFLLYFIYFSFHLAAGNLPEGNSPLGRPKVGGCMILR
jgi:hypothetical protein